MKHLKLYEEFNFPSQMGIGDRVQFKPMARHCEEMSIKSEWGFGEVVAVRFTEAKVFYDVLCDYYGKVFDNVDSVNVKPSDAAKPSDDPTDKIIGEMP